jgi:hypothetical protein
MSPYDRAAALCVRRLLAKMKSDRWTGRAMLMLVALVALLSGCTSYVTTHLRLERQRTTGPAER